MCKTPIIYSCPCGRAMCNVNTRKKKTWHKDNPRMCHSYASQCVGQSATLTTLAPLPRSQDLSTQT